jgi:hypothetical protein
LEAKPQWIYYRFTPKSNIIPCTQYSYSQDLRHETRIASCLNASKKRGEGCGLMWKKIGSTKEGKYPCLRTSLKISYALSFALEEVRSNGEMDRKKQQFETYK